ncbi:hypothetical protein [Dongshaea marina]|uniref:hypothetical protein n=1 Tax=Dongshaea marina TaxID=2047966 RepID=UPI000D3E9D1A|nr:hypothetical protein [Dongshaea marina]
MKINCAACFLIGLSVLFSLPSYAVADFEQTGCHDNGYNSRLIHQTLVGFKEAVENGTPSKTAEFFRFPLKVYLRDGQHQIINRGYFISNYNRIMPPEIRSRIASINEHQLWCNYQGAMFDAGNIWFSATDNTLIKITAFNYQLQLPAQKHQLGAPVKPISNPSAIQKLLASHMKNESQASSADGQVYKVDINNNGSPDYLFAYRGGGSLRTSGIDTIYEKQGDSWKNISFGDVIYHNFGIDGSGWYLFTDTPFITQKDGLYYMNFYNNTPPQVCSYLWKGDRLSLVSGNKSYCIHHEK